MDSVLQLALDFQSIVSLANIYIREAHAMDENFVLGSNKTAGICIRQPQTLEERLVVAKTYADTLGNRDIVFYVDDPSTDVIANAYEARPERLVLIDASSLEVVWLSGQGPFQYNVGALRTFLESLEVQE